MSAQKTNVNASQGEMPFKNSETDCDAKNKYNMHAPPHEKLPKNKGSKSENKFNLRFSGKRF